MVSYTPYVFGSSKQCINLPPLRKHYVITKTIIKCCPSDNNLYSHNHMELINTVSGHNLRFESEQYILHNVNESFINKKVPHRIVKT